VKDGIVWDGGSPGSGKKLGVVADYTIPGIEGELDEDIVAVYHFFIKKLA
jgi:hypothetical protein